jgi:hypothetical protein
LKQKRGDKRCMNMKDHQQQNLELKEEKGKGDA